MAETARFYRVATSEGASFSLTQHAEEKTTDDDDDDWKYTIGTSAVFVATRRRFPTASDVPIGQIWSWISKAVLIATPHLGSYSRALLDRQDRPDDVSL
jgi:hypothetical protein